MGFYLRKALKVGPLRFNLSKSGIGISTGIKGLRYGMGPRGNYVHMGRNGLYYRKSLSSPSSSENIITTPVVESNTIEIESSDILNMTDSSSAALLDELNKKRKIQTLLPASIGISILTLIVTLLLFFSNTTGIWVIYTALFLSAITIPIVANRDNLVKTTILFYNFEKEEEDKYQKLHETFDILNSTDKIWHLQTIKKVTDTQTYKTSAGASNLITRKLINLEKKSPPYLKTNIQVPFIPVGRQGLYFFPDRILVYDLNGIGAVSYEDLTVEIKQSRFIEEETLPKDTRVVASTWKYVNKSGGPDKRYNPNPELPIVIYEECYFVSKTGLQEALQISKEGNANNFKDVLMNQKLNNKGSKNETVQSIVPKG